MAKIEVAHNPFYEAQRERFALYYDFLAHSSSLLLHSFLATYIVLFVLEQMRTGLVTSFLRLTYVLYGVILFGVISVVLHLPEDSKEERHFSWRSIGWLLVLSLFFGLIMFQKTKHLDELGIFISAAGVLFIFLLGITLLYQWKDNQ